MSNCGSNIQSVLLGNIDTDLLLYPTTRPTIHYIQNRTYFSAYLRLWPSPPIMLRTSLPPDESPSDVCVPSSVLDKPLHLSRLTLNFEPTPARASTSFFTPNDSCFTPLTSESEAESLDDIPSSLWNSFVSCFKIERGLLARRLKSPSSRLKADFGELDNSLLVFKMPFLSRGFGLLSRLASSETRKACFYGWHRKCQ